MTIMNDVRKEFEKKNMEAFEELFEYAYKENLWFYCSLGGYVFHPDQLRENHKRGRFFLECESV